jgi:hypothetical protein
METNPIKAKELKPVLHRWLDETDVKCACAIGIKNLTKGYELENPRVYLSGGKAVHELIEKVEPENASAGFFTKTEYALKGTSGCLCYDIGNTDYMVTAFWHVPFSETLSDNHFNLRVLKVGECNKQLFDFLQKDSKTANGELMREDFGFRLCGCMGREEKCMLIVDLYESGRMGVLSIGQPVRTHELESRLRGWLDECDVKAACAIGVSNFSGRQLLSPRIYIDSGRSVVDPPSAVDQDYAGPCLFSKRKYSLKGTAGCLAYEIKGTELFLTVMWSVPFSETLGENRYTVSVLNKVDVNDQLFKKLWDQSKAAKDGELQREDLGFQVKARMEATGHALLIAEIRPGLGKKGWW